MVSRLFIHVYEFSLADDNEAVNNLGRSKFQSRLGVNEKLDLLQRAEENYYRKENTNRQVHLLCIIPTLLVEKVFFIFLYPSFYFPWLELLAVDTKTELFMNL